jgi:hypothetical protein
MVKKAVSILGILAIVLGICWAAGFVEFTYPNIVPNEPLSHPQKVREINGTNMVLVSGDRIALSLPYSSERSVEEISLEISNQVSRSCYEVDVVEKHGDRVEIYVRWPRKFRDSAPPFTIPLIRETIGRYYRKSLAVGQHLAAESRNDPAKDGR